MLNSSSGAALLDSSEWTCLELLGEDRLDWLQGQATNDVRSLTPGKSLSFCLCEPNGSLLAVLDAWALEDRILLTTAREVEQAVLDRVERMTILEDVSASVSPMVSASIQGAGAGERLRKLIDLPVEDAGTGTYQGATVYALRSRRTAAGGWDVWLPAELSHYFGEGLSPMPPDQYEAERIEAGIPKWGFDMGPKTLPPELGSDFEARHVSYQKGCYTGQEVLMRIHSRGHTNRTWVGLIATAPMPVGTIVEHGGKAVGTITSSAQSMSLGYVAAAVLRNEATQEGERVIVADVEAVVHPMPLLRSLE